MKKMVTPLGSHGFQQIQFVNAFLYLTVSTIFFLFFFGFRSTFSDEKIFIASLVAIIKPLPPELCVWRLKLFAFFSFL